jgi:hypothetical protein
MIFHEIKNSPPIRLISKKGLIRRKKDKKFSVPINIISLRRR